MRATILVSITFWTLMAITIKFNLEIIQIDIANIFVYYNLNKVIYIKLRLGFNKGKIDKVLYLRKDLYRL